VQGWGADFIPKLVEEAVDASLFDEIIPISGVDALRLTRELATKEGIFAGISSGATLAGALKVCETARPGANVLFMVPDTGERYLTTVLFENIPVEMDPDEIEIAGSTPLCRFDAPPPPPTSAERVATQESTAEAKEFFAEVIADENQPVVLYALEWCEFCWSVRKMLAAYQIEYRSVDLDSVAYQDDNWGGKIRVALNETTGSKTIPQIFVGGEFIGGATELFDAFKDGSLQPMLEKSRVAYDREMETDPYSFLPTWLHPR
jgi:cysteine synthase A